MRGILAQFGAGHRFVGAAVLGRQHVAPAAIGAFVDECLPLEYLAATSRARFRVGSFNDSKTSYYELMINNQKNKDLKYLLQQINHFLKVINP